MYTAVYKLVHCSGEQEYDLRSLGPRRSKAACLLQGEAVSLSSQLLGLRCPSTGTCRLWVGPGLGANKLEVGFHSAACQHQGPSMWQMEFLTTAATSVCVPRVSCRCHLSHQETLSSGSGPGLGSSQITASVPSPRIEILCVPFKNEISFLQPFGTPKSNHHCLQSQMF